VQTEPKSDLVTSKIPASETFARFKGALRQVLTVSKSDLNQLLADDKAAKEGKTKPGPRPKPSSSGRASRVSG
jgi:hypothetical protein